MAFAPAAPVTVAMFEGSLLRSKGSDSIDLAQQLIENTNHPSAWLNTLLTIHGQASIPILGNADTPVSLHELYRRPGNDDETCRSQYRNLFSSANPDAELEEITESTNKVWVLGNDRFRRKIEVLLERQASSRPRGGDRKSEKFLDRKQINRV